jgi:hypothetical protein
VDQGHGFETDEAPDPTTAGNLLRASGREIYLMKTPMGEVRFELRGTVVHMRKWSNALSDA